MYKVGDVLDKKYKVTGVCSDSGGMGMVLLVQKDGAGTVLALKYCKQGADEEVLKRFRREVRLLGSFKGNSKIVQILDDGLDQSPPYYVMQYYPDGDVGGSAARIRASVELQENVFLQMIDGIQELHARNEYHRDIKPANFLLQGDQVVVSDFGITTEIGSGTAFTRSSMYWGTHGYIPPEFLDGGFKHADAAGDIFMLGKTIYVVLTGRDPMYLRADGVQPSLFHVIQRCCSVAKGDRYQTLAELKQSLVSAYDVITGRAGGVGKARQLLAEISDRLALVRDFDPEQVQQFVEQVSLLENGDQRRIVDDLPEDFFGIMSQPQVVGALPRFLSSYEIMIETKDYSWGYAETIASRMRIIFDAPDVPVGHKSRALDLAVRAAVYMHRFAAMDTCSAMIKRVADNDLAFEVAAVIQKHNDATFLQNIEASECNADPIRAAVRAIQPRPAV